ncbi:MAG: hypothetical protein Q8M16_23555 [Pirellulaceae bacterium]|nr:hypothetical protein [Pirellulaceae bacterium]
MAESDDHRQAMTRIIELLQRHFANQQVYVSGDLLLYYEQGNPKKFVVPDAFIVKGKSPINRCRANDWSMAIIKPFPTNRPAGSTVKNWGWNFAAKIRNCSSSIAAQKTGS